MCKFCMRSARQQLNMGGSFCKESIKASRTLTVIVSPAAYQELSTAVMCKDRTPVFILEQSKLEIKNVFNEIIKYPIFLVADNVLVK